MADLEKLAESLTPKKRELLELLLKERREKAGQKTESSSEKPAADRIPRRQQFSPAPVSFAQQRLWFIDQLDPGTPAFNIPAAVRIRGPLDVKVLERCFAEIVKRHETLRTSFGSEDGTPVQIIAEHAEFSVPVVDLRGLPADQRMNTVQRHITRDCQRSFDLKRCPLMRATLARMEQDDQVLILMMHHIIGDVWSVRVVMRELAAFYKAFGSDSLPSLPELPIQYADYAIWQREWLQGEVLNAQLSYWTNKLSGMPEELQLPTDRPRPAVQSIWGAKHFLKISREVADALRAIGRQEKASLFMILLAAWKALLHRYTGQNDIVVGAPVANRSRSEFEGMVGFFVNSLILDTDISGYPTFRELLKRVRETTFGAFNNQDFPFERLVEILQPARNMSRNPLFQTDFILQNSPRSSYEVTDLSFEALPVENGTAQLDMTLDLWEEPDGIGGWLEYDIDLFDASTAARIVSHFTNILEAIIVDPDRKLSEYSLLSEAEKHELLVEWNNTDRPYDIDTPFPRLFEAQVERGPHVIAAACGEEQISYSELNGRANFLAQILAAHRVGPDVVVALLDRRGVRLLTAIVAVMKASGAYLPLDPAHPAQRYRKIIEQSGTHLILTAREFFPAIEAALSQMDAERAPEVLVLEDLPEPQAEVADLSVHSLPDNLAYVIYTSGSTGAPKGVAIPQRGMVNHLWANIEALQMTSDDRLAQTASQCFDISVWQFLAPLLIGARVQIIPEEITQDPALLLREVEQRGITLFETVPSLLQAALSDIVAQNKSRPELRALRWLLPTGEEVSTALCRRWLKDFPHVPLMNAYGPSECSDDVTFHAICEPPDEQLHRVPIGRPVGNLRVCVVDKNLHQVPIGVPGELCVRGVGVGRGYLREPDRSAAVFVPDPFSSRPGERMYRSGDLARYRPAGHIEFLGRIDHQVKVRGFRIELGEIESVLRQHPDIRETVVIVREDVPGDPRIVAYLVFNIGCAPSTADLRDFLKVQLPDYMLPSAFVALDALPLSSNGKIDRKALPSPDNASSDAGSFVAPRNPTEEVLCAIWCEILEIERLGVEDNLFERGAHSLLVTQVLSRVRKTFRVEPPLRQFFEAPTVAGMARTIERCQSDTEGLTAPTIVPIKRGGHLPLSFTQERMWFLDQLEPGLTAYNVPGAVYMDGRLSPAALEQGLGEIVRRHEIFRTTYSSYDGRPIQIIHEAGPFEIPIVDLGGLRRDDREAEALRLAKENAGRPFDLSHQSVLRCFLVNIETEKHMMAMTTHHIAYDMWAREIFIFELAMLYQAFIKGELSPLPEPEIQWVDYASWQREWLQGEVLEKQLDYWRRKLAPAPAYLDLPIDLPRPSVQSYRGARQYLQLPPETSRGIAALSKKLGVTRFMVVLAAFKTLLYKHTGQDQIVVGSPIANRNRLEVEKLMGFVANTLVLYTDLSGNPTFGELLERVRETTLGAHAHQDVPFEYLVQALQAQRDMSRPPLFQVMFNYMLSYSSPKVDLPELTLRLERLHSGAAQFEINVDVWETPDGLNGVVEYCTELFHHSTITRFVRQFGTLLDGVVAAPGRRLSEYEVMSEAERQQVFIEWNDTTKPYELQTSYSDLFAAQAERTPYATAVACGEEQLSYKELNRKASSLARLLVDEGVGSDTVVAILAKRGIRLLTAILGVLKAGGAYLPLDPAHPSKRHKRILQQSSTRLILLERDFLPAIEEALDQLESKDAPIIIVLEDVGEPQQELESFSVTTFGDNLSYVIYTSGSTGAPKGVMVHERGMINHMWACIEALEMTDKDVLAQTASQCFDISVWQFLAPLILGGRVQILPDEVTKDPSLLLKEIDRHGITIFESVPSLLQVALAEVKGRKEQRPSLRALRWVLPTGEEVKAAFCCEWLDEYPRIPLLNVYGPTECSDDVTFEAIYAKPSGESRRVAIGRPIGNVKTCVLNKDLLPTPVGVSGELCIRGIAVGRGYLGMPDRTAVSFVPDPFSREPGCRMYRSGDRVRYLPDGRIEFLGRMDHQVKVRGFRIELGEIESVLRQHPGVGEAVVIVREDVARDPRLVGYVVWKNGDAPANSDLKDHLKQQLPDYMVPSTYIALEAMPLSSNGKIDRNALPAPGEHNRAGESIAYVEPQTELEQEIAQIWKELLAVEKVGLYDDFFDLGGHSLLVAQFISRLRDRLQVEVPLKTFFEASTVAATANAVLAVRWAMQALELRGAAPGETTEEAIMEEGVL
ncbi:MAG: amino acid adenylation domain-containing protein [Blastocatellia bacterium]